MKCSLTRFRIGRALDDGRSLPPSLNAHLTDCPECAAWLRAQENLAGLLRTPVSVTPEAPPLLQAKILRAIRRGKAGARPAPGPAATGGFARLAAAAGVLLLAGGAVWQTGRSTPLFPPTSQPSVVAKLPDTADPGSGESLGNNSLLLAAARLDQPLRREWSLLNADALAAVNALKSGFLPNGLLRE